jgi:hypothetical protein
MGYIALALPALIGGGAAAYGANKQSEASEAATRAQERIANRQLEMQQPYTEAGTNALGQLEEFSETPYTENPAYQLQSEQLSKAINRALAARGMARSSPALNMLGEQERMLGAQFSGQQLGVTQNLASMGQGGAQASTNILGNLGQSQSRNILSQGDITAGTAGGLGALPMQGMNTYMYGKAAGVF